MFQSSTCRTPPSTCIEPRITADFSARPCSSNFYVTAISNQDVTDLRPYFSILSDRFRRLRLRASAPTPGERNLRKHWQENSAWCSKVNKSQQVIPRRPTASKQTSRSVENSLSTFNPRTLQYCWKQSLLTSKNNRICGARVVHKKKDGQDLQACSISKQMVMSPRITRRSKDERDSKSATKITGTNCSQKYSPPQTTSPPSPPSPPAHLKNPATSQMDARSLMYRETTGMPNSAIRTHSLSRVNEIISPVNIKTVKEDPDLCDISFICVKSVPLKSGENQSISSKTNDFSKQISKSSSRAKRDTVLSSIYEQQHDKHTVENKILEIKPITNQHEKRPSVRARAVHCSSLATAKAVHKPNYLRANRNNPRRNNHNRAHCHNEVRDVQTPEETRHLNTPITPLLGFDKQHLYLHRGENYCRNSLFDNDQEPEIMWRILSWLDKVEHNPHLYYGFDTEPN